MYANTVSSSGPLLKVLLPECCGRQVPQPGLPPLAIVKQVDVLGDLTPGLFACGEETVVDQFILECPPEALDGRVIGKRSMMDVTCRAGSRVVGAMTTG